MKHKIGIMGSGAVAQALAKGFVRHGHTVAIGTRDTDKIGKWKKETGVPVTTGSFADAARFGDVVVLAVKGTVAEKLVKDVAHALSGKIVIDATNPIADQAPEKGVLKYFTTQDESLMERLQKAAPEALFVKAFNSVGNAMMANPPYAEKPTMFICGNDAGAKRKVTALLDQLGWETADMGEAAGARAIEPLAILWCIPGFLRNEWQHAFRLLRV